MWIACILHNRIRKELVESLLRTPFYGSSIGVATTMLFKRCELHNANCSYMELGMHYGSDGQDIWMRRQ